MRRVTQEQAYRLGRAFSGAEKVFERVVKAAGRRAGGA